MKTKAPASKKASTTKASNGKNEATKKVAAKATKSTKASDSEEIGKNLMMEDPAKAFGLSSKSPVKKKTTNSKVVANKTTNKGKELNPFENKKTDKTKSPAKVATKKKASKTKAKVATKAKAVKKAPLKPTAAPIKKEPVETKIPESDFQKNGSPIAETVEQPVPKTEIPKQEKQENEKANSVSIDKITKSNGTQYNFNGGNFDWIKEAQVNYLKMLEKQMNMYQEMLNAIPGGNPFKSHPVKNLMENMLDSNPFTKALVNMINNYKS